MEVTPSRFLFSPHCSFKCRPHLPRGHTNPFPAWAGAPAVYTPGCKGLDAGLCPAGFLPTKGCLMGAGGWKGQPALSQGHHGSCSSKAAFEQLRS